MILDGSRGGVDTWRSAVLERVGVWILRRCTQVRQNMHHRATVRCAAFRGEPCKDNESGQQKRRHAQEPSLVRAMVRSGQVQFGSFWTGAFKGTCDVLDGAITRRSNMWNLHFSFSSQPPIAKHGRRSAKAEFDQTQTDQSRPRRSRSDEHRNNAEKLTGTQAAKTATSASSTSTAAAQQTKIIGKLCCVTVHRRNRCSKFHQRTCSCPRSDCRWDQWCSTWCHSNVYKKKNPGAATSHPANTTIREFHLRGSV